MKLKTLMRQLEPTSHTICDSWPQVAFEHRVNNKKEKFKVTRQGSDVFGFEGTLTNPVEFYVLMDFLSHSPISIKENDMLSLKENVCKCGADDWEFLGHGDVCLGPEAGWMFTMLRCKSCGCYANLQTGIR